MKLARDQRVNVEMAESRALAALTRVPQPASAIAAAIWPKHEMRAQGAGAAASRILKRLEKRGMARWTVEGLGAHQNWGWRL